MDPELKNRLTSTSLWTRALYMILFMIAYAFAEAVMAVTVVIQFFIILVSGSANEALLRFGNNVSIYIYDIIQFQTFNSEQKVWPFAEWPDREPDENQWVTPMPEPTASAPAPESPPPPPPPAGAPDAAAEAEPTPPSKPAPPGEPAPPSKPDDDSATDAGEQPEDRR